MNPQGEYMTTVKKIKELKPVADELNEALGLDGKDKIKTVAVKATTLQETLINVCAEYDMSEVELSEDSFALLEEIGAIVSEEEEETEIEEEEETEIEEETEQEEQEEIEGDEVDEEELPVAEDLKEEKRSVPKLSKKIKDTAIEVVSDLVKVLKLTDNGKNPIPKYKKLSFEDLFQKIFEASQLIGQPYGEDGKEVMPEETKKDFKQATLDFFEAAGFDVSWPDEEEETEVEEKQEKTTDSDFPEYEFHEYCLMFPEMDEDQFSEFVDDIETNGLNEDILLFQGKIADGRSRYFACKATHDDPDRKSVDPRFTVWNGTEDELFTWLVSTNIKRRHLTPAQRAAFGAEILPQYEKIGKKKQATTTKGKGKKKAEKPFRASEEAAKATGSTKEAVTKAKAVKKKNPKAFKDMKAGKKTLAAATRETKGDSGEVVYADEQKVFKAKSQAFRKAVHKFIDVIENTETKVNFSDDLELLDTTLQEIIKKLS